MQTRKKSIEALLARADEDLKKIEAEYAKALTEQTIPDDLRIDIKNLSGNLRSVLDYLARDIRETHCPAAKAKDIFYFPILSDAVTFGKKMATWYPGLETTERTLWDYLESIQPYHASTIWLSQFNRLNNENKHDDLVAQTRTEIKEVRVDTPGGRVSWNPGAVKFGPGVSIGGVPIDPRTQMPMPHPSQQVSQIIWVDFRFDGIDVSAIALLRASLVGVKNLVADIYAWL
ncbi:MAG: hypothetical protein M3X11_02320 [Acidobacteriota bacterium]|nr:hypothetical protein [Acidobacteriota bacterium]